MHENHTRIRKKNPHTTEVKLQGCRFVPKNILKETTPPQMIQSAGSKYPGETRGLVA